MKTKKVMLTVFILVIMVMLQPTAALARGGGGVGGSYGKSSTRSSTRSSTPKASPSKSSSVSKNSSSTSSSVSKNTGANVPKSNISSIHTWGSSSYGLPYYRPGFSSHWVSGMTQALGVALLFKIILDIFPFVVVGIVIFWIMKRRRRY